MAGAGLPWPLLHPPSLGLAVPRIIVQNWSAAHLEDSPEAIGPLLLEALATATEVPTPSTIHLAAHRWRYSMGADPAERQSLFDANWGLVLCGDWLARGRVEGAFLSGVSAAGYILRQIEIPR